MGTITERKRKNGSIAYLAQISINRGGQRAHSESKTFDRRPAATAWIKKREKELAGGEALGSKRQKAQTLADAIDRYLAESRKAMGKTKAQVLASLRQMDISELPCSAIRSHDIVELARQLGDERQPSTVANYMSHLSAIFTVARPAWGFDLDPQIMKDAQIVNQRMGFTGKSRSRERRPTLDELDLILTRFEQIKVARPRSNPMVKIVIFALFSTRRQDEVCRIRWNDLNELERRQLVRDMKNPGDKIGNDIWVEMPPEALAVIKSMPKVADEIFPFSAGAISKAWTDATDALGIDDLHFHDLRHEGVSRLFEMGYTIPQAASVSGHRSWTSLKRYTHMSQVGDKYDGWHWLERALNGAA